MPPSQQTLLTTQLADGWMQGNPNAALGRWDVAEKCFGKAAAIAPEFAFAAGNHALALFQLGKTDEALRQMR